MGRMAIIIVLGLSLTIGVVGYNLNKSKNAIVENVSGFMRYSTARNLAHTGVNMLLRRLDRNDTAFSNPFTSGGTSYMSVNAMSGICSLSVKLANPAYLDTILINSKARFMDTAYAMQVRLYRTPVPFPNVNAAIGVHATPAAITVSGGASVDGHNWDSTGTVLVGSGDVTGLTVMTKTDSANVHLNGGSTIDGLGGPTPPNVKIDTTVADLAPYMEQYADAADVVFNTPGTVGSSTRKYIYGTAANPEIVVCNAGNDTNFSIIFKGQFTGVGILAISGSVTFSGGLNWSGLVIAYGQNTIVNFTEVGNSSIVGAIIEAGNSGASLTISGNAGKVKYSSSALRNARYINKLQAYRVLYWYE